MRNSESLESVTREAANTEIGSSVSLAILMRKASADTSNFFQIEGRSLILRSSTFEESNRGPGGIRISAAAMLHSNSNCHASLRVVQGTLFLIIESQSGNN